MAETTASLRAQLLAVADVDILKDPNTFKSTFEILDELSQHWEKLTDVERAALTEVIAGKRQGEQYCPLLWQHNSKQLAKIGKHHEDGNTEGKSKWNPVTTTET